MKFTAAGDVLCQRRLPEGYEGFDAVRAFLLRGDVRFFNLETTVNREGECYACQHSGGTYVRCEPETAADMLKFGFNLTTFNNNHAMDFDHTGMEKTIEYVSAMGIVHGGVGRNLHEASAPVYLETKNGRAALVAVNTSFQDALLAGEQSRRLPGRPGINGIRVTQKMVLPEEAFRFALEIGEKTRINEPKNVTRREGYYPWPAEGTGELGSLQFVRGESYGLRYEANEGDTERVLRSIREAAQQADYVLVSLHSHQLTGEDKREVPDFLRVLCRGFVDAGADAVIGHGPHLLRAAEVYREKPIFYSLGDFVIQLYNVPVAPEDFYRQYGMNSDEPVIELLKKRSGGFARGLMEDSRMLETVIPYWETDGDRKLTRLEFLPVKASKGEGKHLEGLPVPARDTGFMETFASLSAPFGLKISLENGVWTGKW